MASFCDFDYFRHCEGNYCFHRNFQLLDLRKLWQIIRLGMRCPYFFESTKKVVHSRDIWASSSKYFGFCSLMKLNRFCLIFFDSLVTTLADEYLAVRTFMFRVHGYGYGCKSTFFQSSLRTSKRKFCFRAGNGVKRKREISTFQNFKNYWKILIIEKVTSKSLSDFHDEIC